MNIKAIALLCFVRLEMCFGGCIDSYVIICDSVSDFQQINKNEEFTLDVLIQSDGLTKKTKFDMGMFLFVESLTAVGQFSGFFPPIFDFYYMETLNLYDNDFRIVTKKDFNYRCRLKELILRKNNIEFIERDTFAECQPIYVDLSDNKLGVIPEFTFNRRWGQNDIKTIIIRRNKLAYIHPQSLPHSLEVLKLEDNRLRFFAVGVFANLRNLKQLYVSKNLLFKLPDLTPSTVLKILDFSHNSLNVVDMKKFGNNTEVTILDLSHNRITQVKPGFNTGFNFIDFGHNQLRSVEFLSSMRGNFGDISLAFNLLNNLDLKLLGDPNITMWLLLYGNPWKCGDWIKIEKSMINVSVNQHPCDMKFFNEGVYPFCVGSFPFPSFFPNKNDSNYKNPDDLFVDYDHFLEAVNDSIVHYTIECNIIKRHLIMQRYHAFVGGYWNDA